MQDVSQASPCPTLCLAFRFSQSGSFQNSSEQTNMSTIFLTANAQRLRREGRDSWSWPLFPPELKTSGVRCRLWISRLTAGSERRILCSLLLLYFKRALSSPAVSGCSKNISQHPSCKSEPGEVPTLISVTKMTGINSQDTLQKQWSFPSPDIL